uniref:Uncharacterized protein n=1 Tax=Arundo donax TaxID=35708 RepID=A0A0A8Y818_ARUDO
MVRFSISTVQSVGV